jgi:hypothetical protein
VRNKLGRTSHFCAKVRPIPADNRVEWPSELVELGSDAEPRGPGVGPGTDEGSGTYLLSQHGLVHPRVGECQVGTVLTAREARTAGVAPAVCVVVSFTTPETGVRCTPRSITAPTQGWAADAGGLPSVSGGGTTWVAHATSPGPLGNQDVGHPFAPRPSLASVDSSGNRRMRRSVDPRLFAPHSRTITTVVLTASRGPVSTHAPSVHNAHTARGRSSRKVRTC